MAHKVLLGLPPTLGDKNHVEGLSKSWFIVSDRSTSNSWQQEPRLKAIQELAHKCLLGLPPALGNRNINLNCGQLMCWGLGSETKGLLVEQSLDENPQISQKKTCWSHSCLKTLWVIPNRSSALTCKKQETSCYHSNGPSSVKKKLLSQQRSMQVI